MPAQAATENRIADALMTELNKIGGVGDWLTTPSVKAEGVPGDPLPTLASGPALYLEIVGTPRDDEASSVTGHGVRVTFLAWCIAKNRRDACSLKADVLRAIYAAEGTLAALFQTPAREGDFEFSNDAKFAGVYAGRLEVFVATQIDHANP